MNRKECDNAIKKSIASHPALANYWGEICAEIRCIAKDETPSPDGLYYVQFSSVVEWERPAKITLGFKGICEYHVGQTYIFRIIPT